MHSPPNGFEKRRGGVISQVTSCLPFLENRSSRFIRLLAIATVILFLGSIWSFSRRTADIDEPLITQPPPPTSSPPDVTSPPATKSEFDFEFHPDSAINKIPEGSEDAVLVIKTGSQVLWQRAPIHLLTTTTLTPNFLIFSDLAERIGNVPVHDCLKNVGPKLRVDHNQFGIYRQAKLVKPFPGFTPKKDVFASAPSSRPYNVEIAKMDLKGGWDLDKYKNVPILYQTYKAFPNKKWYIFMDADSFLFMGNTIRYLNANYNPDKPLYIGSQTMLGNEIFAHGGTGYILSGAAAKLAVVDHPELEHAFEEYAIGHCCGDHVLSRLLDKIGIKLSYERGQMQGEPWYGLRWDSSTWCSKILTFHHVSQGDVQELWEFEMQMEQKLRKDDRNNGFILYSDLYHRFARPYLTSLEPTWDNLSNDKWLERPSFPSGFSDENQPKESDLANIQDDDSRNKWTMWFKLSDLERAAPFDRGKCNEACRQSNDCLQWKWVNGKCVMNNSLIFGQKDHTGTTDTAWWSGWMLEKIEKMRSQQSCENGLDGGFPAEEKKKKKGDGAGAEQEDD